MVLRGGPDKRSLAKNLFARLYIRSTRQQRVDRVDVTRARRHHQSCLPLWQQGVDVCSSLDQRFNDDAGAIERSERKGCDAVAIGEVGLGARPQQRLDARDIVRLHGPVECRGPIGLGDVHVGPVLQQRPDRFTIA